MCWKLLCGIVTDAKGFVRQSVGDDVSEERVNVITAAYSLVGEVGYFWGGKSTQIGKDSSWGSAEKVSAAGSASSGTAYRTRTKRTIEICSQHRKSAESCHQTCTQFFQYFVFEHIQTSFQKARKYVL